jgi:hypothetical protein
VAQLLDDFFEVQLSFMMDLQDGKLTIAVQQIIDIPLLLKLEIVIIVQHQGIFFKNPRRLSNQTLPSLTNSNCTQQILQFKLQKHKFQQFIG